MNFKFFISILLGKAIIAATKILNIGGGSAAPGLYALKFEPKLVSKLSRQIPKTIVITGTNGKTTTSKMLGHFLESQGLKVLRNTTGSNLERGIASALISGFNFFKQKLEFDVAIWELDEAAFNSVAPKLSPDIVVFLNVFRDQLDRYGEIDSIVAKWCETAKKLSKDTRIILNGDDASLTALEECFKSKPQTFGVSKHKIMGEKVLLNKQKLDFEAKNIEIEGLEGTKFEVETKSGKWGIALSIPGIYHVYDFMAAFAVSQTLKLKTGSIINSFKSFTPAFGRVEKFKLPESQNISYIFLIKNPVGATQVFETIKPDLREDDRLLLALNDNFADGTDVSWIWDADFEELRFKSKNLKIFCAGDRAEELEVRLKYAGFDPKDIEVVNDLENAFEASGNGLKGRLFILPTYTALLDLQKVLAKKGIKERYWKD